MKKFWRILLIFLLAAGILAAVSYLIPPTAANLRSISVTDYIQYSLEDYTLAPQEAEQFIAALHGVKSDRLPDGIENVFDVVLHLRTSFPRRYSVYASSDHDIWLQRSGSQEYIRAENPEFFYTHKAFFSIYLYAEMPALHLAVQDEEIFPQVQGRWWQFLGGDGEWHEGRLPPLPGAGTQGVTTQVTQGDGSLVLRFITQENRPPVSPPLPAKSFLSITDPSGESLFDGYFDLNDGLLPHFLQNGFYDCSLSLYWEDKAQLYRGGYEASFSLQVELPTVFEIPDTIVQGEMAAFYALHVPEGVMPVFKFDLDFKPRYYPFEDGYVTYLPTHYGTKPGEYRVTYGLEGGTQEEKTLILLPHEYHIQYLNVDPSIEASTRNDAAYEQFARYFPESRATSADERFYDESFLLPVAGRLTTEFGETRYVNNAPTSYRHSGLDIAAPAGTAILATNSGRVTLAMELILTGNTIVIDHGQGLFSIYYHMQKLLTEKGALVQRGQVIGEVGSTGFSTGPHLHFTVSYYDHNLEPGFFLAGEPITYQNAPRYLVRP